ncbi:hypothetical protein GCM10010294_26300 [Streptomyces griseoloalbus]|nr:hypothetical protein GCM10010294_26300 [Streptomyces griseoloalbus]
MPARPTGPRDRGAACAMRVLLSPAPAYQGTPPASRWQVGCAKTADGDRMRAARARVSLGP